MKDIDIDSRVGANIRRIRKGLGHSPDDIAAWVGVAPATYRKYEDGSVRVTSARLLLLSKRFNVSIDRFFDGLPTLAPDPAAHSTPVIDYSNQSTRREVHQLVSFFDQLRDEEARRALLDLIRAIAKARSSIDPDGGRAPSGFK